MVVSLPPVTIVNAKPRIESRPVTSPSLRPRATRCRDRVVSRLGAPPLDQFGEVAHQLGDRARRLQRVALALAATMASVQPVEPRPVLVGDAEVVGDDHARQRLEQLGHHVALTRRPQSLDALDDERPDRPARPR